MEKGGGSGEGGCRGMSGRMKEDRGGTEGRQRREKQLGNINIDVENFQVI